MHICLVGIGNAWAADDGVGLEVVHRLRAEHTAGERERGSAAEAPAVQFVTFPSAGPEMIDLLDGCDLLLVVDAVSSGAPPGTVHRHVWQPGLLDSRGIERASSHGLGIRETLELAAALNRLPTRVLLWGIEVASTAPGQGLSPAVAAALPVVVDQLRQALETGCFAAEP